MQQHGTNALVKDKAAHKEAKACVFWDWPHKHCTGCSNKLWTKASKPVKPKGFEPLNSKESEPLNPIEREPQNLEPQYFKFAPVALKQKATDHELCTLSPVNPKTPLKVCMNAIPKGSYVVSCWICYGF